MCSREDLLGPGRVKGQVTRQDLHSVTRSPQPRHVGLLEATRRDQLGALWESRRSPR